ncbi:nitrogenase subunit nifH [Caldinitratiruptor microaerophilus]|uniref:nitrogenase n=1 Tax=Caldinitratiruptor microaerophilus TaxID=671077 RepID=A0AA35CKP5_9FIRM|nr:nitrogenase subunit nifH [Caldinitratiruptor microaerophilus]
MRKIAIYGKGGIGKSTTAANLAAALAEQGLRVMQVGCDPKADSTLYLTGRRLRTVLDLLKEKRALTLPDIVHEGFRGVLCVEAGGPTPGLGCAGRGIITAFEQLDALQAFAVYRPDVVLYDVLGDVVCGGFAMPIRAGYAREVFIVTSGERMALYAAYNIAQAVQQFRGRGYARLAGVILNRRGIPDEERIVAEVARDDLGTEVLATIPRDPVVQACEERGVTVIEGAPDSALAGIYRNLAQAVLAASEDVPADPPGPGGAVRRPAPFAFAGTGAADGKGIALHLTDHGQTEEGRGT